MHAPRVVSCRALGRFRNGFGISKSKPANQWLSATAREIAVIVSYTGLKARGRAEFRPYRLFADGRFAFVGFSAGGNIPVQGRHPLSLKYETWSAEESRIRMPRFPSRHPESVRKIPFLSRYP